MTDDLLTSKSLAALGARCDSWAPLSNNDHAMELLIAFELSLRVETLPHAKYIVAYNDLVSCREVLADVRSAEPISRAAATRRAIVRAVVAATQENHTNV